MADSSVIPPDEDKASAILPDVPAFEPIPLQEAMALLEPLYGHFSLRPCDDHLKELVLTILSHRTNRADELAAFNTMWQRFGSWQAIQAAPPDDVIATLGRARFPERKGPYIQQTVARVHQLRGEYNIDFLADIPTDEAMAWLQDLPGVGAKTSSLLMLFCFHQVALPVDTHVHRVSLRLGVLSPRTSAERAHVLLLGMLPAEPEVLYNFHKLFFKHGQKLCSYSNPRCEACPLRHRCQYAIERGRNR